VIFHNRRYRLLTRAGRRTKQQIEFPRHWAVYRPRRELQKAAPRNFDAFFEPVYLRKQKKTVEIPAVRAHFILGF
jgi:hypothetical protein